MVPGTAFLHACRYLDSRGAPTPHLRTPHAGAARTYPHPACTQKVPGNKVFRIWQAGALDSGNKIAASAHGMGSGGLAVDAMAIGCLGVERRVERFFSYLAISSTPDDFLRLGFEGGIMLYVPRHLSNKVEYKVLSCISVHYQSRMT